MLRFKFFSFPVEVQWPFWLISALLCGATTASGTHEVRALIVKVIVVFISILLHELGHAFAMKHFGDSRVNIVLHGMGGYAQGTAWRGRTENIIISAAGPVASLLIGALGWLVYKALPMPVATFDGVRFHASMVSIAFATWMWVNIGWALINLLPVIPLDGGHISQAIHGSERERQALRLSFYSALIVAALFLFFQHSLWNAGLFAMLAWNNWQELNHRDQIR